MYVCMYVCMYFLSAALNFVLSFLRIVTLGGKLLKIVMPAKCTFFKKVYVGTWSRKISVNFVFRPLGLFQLQAGEKPVQLSLWRLTFGRSEGF